MGWTYSIQGQQQNTLSIRAMETIRSLTQGIYDHVGIDNIIYDQGIYLERGNRLEWKLCGLMWHQSVGELSAKWLNINLAVSTVNYNILIYTI